MNEILKKCEWNIKEIWNKYQRNMNFTLKKYDWTIKDPHAALVHQR